MLPSKQNKDIFQDIRETNTGKPVNPPPIIASDVREKVKRVKPTKTNQRKVPRQKAGNVSCTFHLSENIRRDIQALSFMLDTPQNKLVEQAITRLVKSKGIELPKKVA
tara:strand:+ start:188 stop:511 length:324 start_codon:yes stop_codon:yes gene_type:complete